MSLPKRIRLNGLRQNTVAGLWRHPHSQAHHMDLRGHP